MNEGYPAAIGSALMFYARYPEEMDLFDDEANDEENIRRHFEFLSETQYSELRYRVQRVSDVASRQAREIMDAFSSKLEYSSVSRSARFSRIQNGHRWDTEIRLFRKSGRVPSLSPINTGLSIDVNKGQLVARSWIWVRGIDRQLVFDKIKKEVFKKETDKEKILSGDIEYRGSIILCQMDIGTLESSITIDAFVDPILAPLLAITDRTWSELFEMAQ